MSSPNKKPINQDDGDEEEEEEEEEDEEDYNDDEDEDEFVPGEDDEDDGDYEENAEEANYIQGIVSLDEKLNVQYKGDGFYLSSTASAPYHFLHAKHGASAEDSSSSFTLIMNGYISIADTDKTKKPTPRQFQVTWQRSKLGEDGTTTIGIDSSTNETMADEKMPALVYHVFGKQTHDDKTSSSAADLVEFQGDLQPPTNDTTTNACDLLCQVRVIRNNAVAHRSGGETAAAAAVAKHRKSEDDEIEDADEEVDFNEVLALNEESQIPVEALRKRYQNGGQVEIEVPPKKGKLEDDDDDADIGF
jgi:hypothetical protein